MIGGHGPVAPLGSATAKNRTRHVRSNWLKWAITSEWQKFLQRFINKITISMASLSETYSNVEKCCKLVKLLQVNWKCFCGVQSSTVVHSLSSSQSTVHKFEHNSLSFTTIFNQCNCANLTECNEHAICKYLQQENNSRHLVIYLRQGGDVFVSVCWFVAYVYLMWAGRLMISCKRNFVKHFEAKFLLLTGQKQLIRRWRWPGSRSISMGFSSFRLF